MEAGIRISILRVGNGFVVQPERVPGDISPLADTLVFNDMGFATAADGSGRDCLLTFIERHFSEKAK